METGKWDKSELFFGEPTVKHLPSNHWLTYYLLYSFGFSPLPVHFPSLTILSEITLQISYLHTILCLRETTGKKNLTIPSWHCCWPGRLASEHRAGCWISPFIDERSFQGTKNCHEPILTAREPEVTQPGENLYPKRLWGGKWLTQNSLEERNWISYSAKLVDIVCEHHGLQCVLGQCFQTSRKL